MLVLDLTTGKHLGIFMVSAYSPSSDASENDQLDFENVLYVYLRQVSVVILVIFSLFVPMPMLASAGVILNVMMLTHMYTYVGPYEINNDNLSGGRLRSFLEIHDLASLSSFF